MESGAVSRIPARYGHLIAFTRPVVAVMVHLKVTSVGAEVSKTCNSETAKSVQ